MKKDLKYLAILIAFIAVSFMLRFFSIHDFNNNSNSEIERIPSSTQNELITQNQTIPDQMPSSDSQNLKTQNTESEPSKTTPKVIFDNPPLIPTPLQTEKQNRTEQQIQTQPQESPQHETIPQTQMTVSSQKMGLSLFFGFGSNYFQYKEDLFDANTRYNGLKSPSYHFGLNIKTSDVTDLEAFYKITPLFFDNGSVGLAKTEDSWKTLGIQEARKSEHYSRTKSTDENPQSEDRDFRWLYGIQIHEMPLALFANNNTTPTLRTIDLVNLSIGTKSTSYINPWTRTIVFARLQYPISSSPTSGGSFTLLNPDLLFDGSLGIEKRIISNFWLGLHWYGTYHQIDFKYSDTVINAQGTQSAFFSTLEARLLFDF